MLITYHGHAQFLLETQSGLRILTDPYAAYVGYPMQTVAADAVTVSHGHDDHNDTSKALEPFTRIDTPEPIALEETTRVYGVPTFHDDCGGAARGGNIVFVIESDGLRVVHAGDLGHPLSAQQRAAIGLADVLLLPVGGHYTLPVEQAAQVMRDLSPAVTIPMHHKTPYNAAWPIADESEFLRLAGAQDAPCVPVLRVTAGDLAQQPRVVRMTPCV